MPKKTKQELLAAFIKRNKKAREAKAKLEGFANAEEYIAHLRKSKSASSKKVVVIPPKTTKKESVKKEELTDMVIAFDTTGSMRSYINNVKNHVVKLIPELFKANPNLMISIVAFGDYCDMTTSDIFGKAYQVLDLTDNQKQLINFVKNARDTGGGDSDEFYELVIKKITEETNWRENSKKSVLFIADAEPHPLGYSYTGRVYQNKIDWKEEAQKAASLGICFDTLRIRPEVKWYEELSKITNGVCLNFKSSEKTAQLVKATVLARGGSATKEFFTKEFAAASASGDKEMIGVYTMYKTILK